MYKACTDRYVIGAFPHGLLTDLQGDRNRRREFTPCTFPAAPLHLVGNLIAAHTYRYQRAYIFDTLISLPRKFTKSRKRPLGVYNVREAALAVSSWLQGIVDDWVLLKPLTACKPPCTYRYTCKSHETYVTQSALGEPGGRICRDIETVAGRGRLHMGEKH